MTNLIPVQRRDKNGLLVTRWVKPEGSSTGRTTLPAPAVGDSGNLRAELSQSLNSNLSAFGIDTKVIVAKAGRLPDATAAALLDMRKRAFERFTVDSIIASALHRNDSPDMLENIALVYNDYQYQELDWEHGQHFAYQIITRDIRGLEQYPQFSGITNFYRADDNIREQAKLLVKVLYEADKAGNASTTTQRHDGAATYLTDPALVQLAIDYSSTEDDRDAFLDTLYDVGCDAEGIANVLDTTKPLRGGVL